MNRKNKGQKKSILLFALSLLIALGLTLLVKEPTFTRTQVYVLFILFFAIGLWFTEAVAPFAVSILIIAFLAFALGNPHLNPNPENIEKYVTTFSNSIIWLMLGGFFMASAMSKTKLDEALFKLTLKLSGTNPRNLLAGLMFSTMMASMLMSNSASTSMVIASLLPLLNSLGEKSGLTKALLLGVPIAASTGGMATVIGSPPNLIAVGALKNSGIEVTFLDWMIFGMPLAIVITGVCCAALMFRYVKDKKPISLSFLEHKKVKLSTEDKVKRIIVLAVIVVTIFLWLTTTLHGITVAAVAALPLVVLTLTGIVTGKDIDGLAWDTLLLVAGGLSLGTALQSSGLLDHYAQNLRNMEMPNMLLTVILAYCTMLFSNVMSNTATCTVMIPLGIAILPGFETPVAVIIALSASTALFLPVSTPPNAIAYSTGFLKISDFRLGGILVGLLGPLLTILWLLLVT